jgi:hypothetical protein
LALVVFSKYRDRFLIQHLDFLTFFNYGLQFQITFSSLSSISFYTYLFSCFLPFLRKADAKVMLFFLFQNFFEFILNLFYRASLFIHFLFLEGSAKLCSFFILSKLFCCFIKTFSPFLMIINRAHF